MLILLEEKRNRVILALYKLYVATKSVNVDTDRLEAQADVGDNFYNILRELGLKGRGWLDFRNQVVRILSPGIENAEELLKARATQLERTILQKFYDSGGPNHMEWVMLDTLTKELNTKFSDIRPILNDLEDRELLEGSGEAMWLTWKGVREV